MDDSPISPLGAAIAARLRAERGRADLTQEQAGKRAGLSWMSVHRYERGRVPTVEALYRLAAAYGVPVFAMLPDELPTPPPPARPKKPGGAR